MMLISPVALVLLFSFFQFLDGITLEWTVDTYPNPMKAGGYKECKMRGLSNVCDPDEIFTESERYRLNNELTRMSRRTEKTDGDACEKRGFEPVLVIMQQGSQEFADQLNEKWNLDGQCHKAMIFVFSADERRLFYSAEDGTGFSTSDFTAVVSGQQTNIAEGKFTSGLVNIFKQIGGARNIQEGSLDAKESYKVQKSESMQRYAVNVIASLLVFVNVL
ncbi:hypothetical protein L596_015468 [Steinernema carpocapsae]|uniref:TPM domain-containing protein n=1 Tax=Steinernema carpocapsae TaxID=34508 RepID=A0A4U5NFY1_STECR|nr:hypothetical protein L596_015468 [Steinernema carpocapsae]